MKKLLGLLAVAPMAIAACGGGAAEETAMKSVHTAYFVGHGANFTDAQNGENGKQNTKYAVIETMLYDTDGNLTYNIEESNGGQVHNPTLTAAASGTPDWTEVTDTEIATDYVASDQHTTDKAAYHAVDGQDEADFVAGDATFDANLVTWRDAQNAYISAATVNSEWNDSKAADTFWTNTGESLRYIYDVVPFDFDRAEDKLVDSAGAEAEFINKDESYGNTDSFYWMSNKKAWENYLSRVYPTCTEVNTLVDADIYAYAEGKGNADDQNIAGATAGESGLYVAASLVAAAEYCEA